MWGHPAPPGGQSNHPEINGKGRLSSIWQLSGQVWRTFLSLCEFLSDIGLLLAGTGERR